MRIFVINLKRSLDRKNYISGLLNHIGIRYEFFEAIDGKNDSAISYFKNKYYSRVRAVCKFATPLKDTEIACFASHFSLWQKCLELNQPIMVLEDDITISNKFMSEFSRICDYAQKFPYFRLGASHKQDTKIMIPIDDFIHKLTKPCYGAFGYVISPSAARLLINQAKTWDCIVDAYIDSYWIHGVSIVALNNYAVDAIRDPNLSNIGYDEKNVIKWYWKISREIYRTYDKLRKYLYNKKHK